ncbi:MAG TPA: HNH endonuclease [Candidatus Saccharimonadia bacterium]|nr:HNH endonuclease [Candidatus Saccharimonadia bacterium]
MNSYLETKMNGSTYKSTKLFPCSNCGKDLYIQKYYYQKKKYKNFYCDRKCAARGRYKPFPSVFNNLKEIYSWGWTESRGYLVCKRRQEFKGKTKMYHQHRVVCEFILNRPLLSSETVNHINGIKNDNRPENLVVLNRSEHPSQAVIVIGILKQRIRDLEMILQKHEITDRPPKLLIEDRSYGVPADI